MKKKGKVLFVHEYSGVHTNLKTGLERLGFEADILSPGDFHKGFHGNIRFPSDQRRWKRDWLTFRFLLNAILNYDAIQFINSTDFGFQGKRARFIARTLMRLHPKTVILAAGCDATYFRQNKVLAYRPCDLCEPQCRFAGGNATDHDFMIQKASWIVPIAWDYRKVYENEPHTKGKLWRVIPMPVDIQAVKYVPAGTNARIRVLHPLKVPNKGTALILKAFERLQKDFAGSVEFIAKGGMPFVEFRELLSTVDIIVDQTTSYSYGMNAVFGMAMGKVVLSGLEDEVTSSQDQFYRDCPVINIRPDLNQIEQTLRAVLAKPQHIRELAQRGRTFAEQNHDCVKVARQYLEVYGLAAQR